MLSAWTYLCGKTDHGSIIPAHARNLYIPKRMSFSYLTKTCNMTFEQSFTRGVGRFNFLWLLVSDMSCFLFQSVSVYNKFQRENVYHKKNGKRVIWVREHTFMTTIQKVGGRLLKIATCLQIFFFFQQLIYCWFLQPVEVGVTKLVILCGCHRWMTPNLSDWMNLAVIQDPRDHDPGHPRIQNKESFSSQISCITWIFIQKFKQIGS